MTDVDLQLAKFNPNKYIFAEQGCPPLRPGKQRRHCARTAKNLAVSVLMDIKVLPSMTKSFLFG